MTVTDQAPPRQIYERMAAVLGELPAIGKNRRNEQQGFMFRGIDDVLDALNPLLAKHQVFFVPEVLERVAETRQTRKGEALWTIHLRVRYRFFAPDGSTVEAEGWGEGTDSGDKATSKAMTMAMKYVLFQVFAISTKEAADADGDAHSPEASVPMRPIPAVADLPPASAIVTADKKRLESLREMARALPDAAQATLRQLMEAEDLPPWSRMTEEQADRWEGLILAVDPFTADELPDPAAAPAQEAGPGEV